MLYAADGGVVTELSPTELIRLSLSGRPVAGCGPCGNCGRFVWPSAGTPRKPY